MTATAKGTICVTMIDTFFSGWGMAEGKRNKLVILCDSYEQAQHVANYADTRPEQKYVTLTTLPTRFVSRIDRGVIEFTEKDHLVQIKLAGEMPAWVAGFAG